MHAGLVIYGSLEQQTGGYLYDRKLVRHLRAAGDRVTVFSLPRRPYPWPVTDALRWPFWRRLARSGVDVLLQDELAHASLCLGNRWLRRRVDVPIVAIVHHLRASEPNGTVQQWLSAGLEKAFFDTVDAAVHNSETTARTVERLAGRIPHRVAYPSGRRFDPPVRPDAVRRRASADGPLRVLFLGSLVPRKRLGVLLEALRQVPGEHWTLDVVGREDANDYVRSMKRRARALDGRVRFHGACSDGRLQNLLERSHVMALPSAYEGFGIAYVEAMGKGMPVIATTSGAAGEYVESGRNGALVTPDDPDAVASWIRHLAADRARLAEMGLEARATYVDMPQWSDTTARIRDFLQRVVAGTIGRHECIGTG